MNISLSNQDKLNLISNLSAMLSAGIPILDTVNSLLEESKGNTKIVLETIKKDLMQGKTLSSSLGRFPKSFDPVTINLIKASEESGTLEDTLKLLEENVKKDIEFNDKIRAALAYPIVVTVAFLAVLVVILVYVVPKISSVLLRLNLDLPLPTRILIATSQFFLSYTIFIIFGFIIFLTGLYLLYRHQKRTFVNIIFSLPVLSSLQKSIDLTRFTRSMALMLSSGIPLTDALGLSENIVTKHDLSLAITYAKERLSSGKPLSEGFKSNKVIPTIMIRITEAGEKSGTLDKSMAQLADHFDYEVTKKLQSFTALLEPVLLVLIGLTVGGIMITIIAPIYQLIGSIRPH